MKRWPAIVTIDDRASAPLAETVKAATPSPTPLAESSVIHEALDAAVQGQPAVAFTLTLTDPRFAVKVRDFEARAREQPAE